MARIVRAEIRNPPVVAHVAKGDLIVGQQFSRIGGASEASYDEDGDGESEEEDKDERPVLLYRTFDKNGNPSRKYKAAHAGKVANNRRVVIRSLRWKSG